ncbi:MAG: hypothetical protein ACQPRH_04575 [Solitalea-like symbiont of Tyrophagus putrescentiae]
MKYLYLYISLLLLNTTSVFAKGAESQPTINFELDNKLLYHKAYDLSELLFDPASGKYTFIKDENRIFPDLVGKVRLNGNINSIYKNYSKKNIYQVIVFSEAKRHKYIDININNKDHSIRITPKCPNNASYNCTIKQITITDPNFIVYDTGVHVGMTLDDLILFYGNTLNLIWKDFNLAVKSDNGIYFILDTESIPKSWFNNKKGTLNTLSLKTKIRAIYLTAI